MSDPPLVVVGASSGGVEALLVLARQVPPDLPAAVCVVLHQPARVPSALPRLLDRAGPLPAVHARDNEPLEAGRIYVAPPDLHLVVEPGRLRLVHGPLENGFRPAIDPLFRTAAATYGPAAIAVVLSGSLDDGSSGALAVKSGGGTVIVQHPTDALYPAMPRNTLDAVGEVDAVAAASALGRVVVAAAREAAALPPRPSARSEPDPIVDLADAGRNLDPVVADALSCPSCNGPLNERGRHQRADTRFRCRVGHGWSQASLATAQASTLEEGLWTAVRVLEERAALCRRLAQRADERRQYRAVAGFRRGITDLEQRARDLRALIARAGHYPDGVRETR